MLEGDLEPALPGCPVPDSGSTYFKDRVSEHTTCTSTSYAMASGNLEVTNTMTYAVELKCDEENTRHYRHVSVGADELPSCPPLIKAGEAGTIPNLFKAAAAQYPDNECMGTREVEICQIEGKKQYWTKGPIQWKTYKEVYDEVEAVAKGLLSCDVVRQS